jgi:MoxR-like ATPase
MPQEEPVPQQELDAGDLEAVKQLNEGYQALRTQIGKVIVGQEQVLEELLITIFCRGHCLMVGVPGLAKTLMVSTLADALDCSFHRIQFTPDLMPSDITGTEVIQENKSTGEREMRFIPGPIFANVILADEINRTPPKTQAALLEAMQERQVTTAGTRRPLEEPFFVLATQNPIEQEGTYPLPEAQLDRFMFNIMVDYPNEDEEFDIVRRTTTNEMPTVAPAMGREQIIRLQEIVRRVPVADHVIRYAMSLVRLTRRGKTEVPAFISDYVSWGAGPRASQFLILSAKARAVLHGRYYVSTEDIRNVALPVMRHRVLTNFNAEAEGITSDDIVRQLIDVVPSGESEALSGGRVPEVFRPEDAG